MSVRQTNTGAWLRYSSFGIVNPEVKHNKYGPLAAFSRFSPIIPDSMPLPPQFYEASIKIEPSTVGYPSVRSFQKVQIFYGNARSESNLRLMSNGVEVASARLIAGSEMHTFQTTLNAPVTNLEMQFSGNDSPDIYGIALDGTGGVAVDNIPMRGSSGTIFNKLNTSQLAQSYEALNAQLFIFQFGGNVMPYLKDTAEAVSYGRWFYSQLKTLKRMRPEAYVIVIGPSDMSYKLGEDYVSYPFIEPVRDALRNATLKAGFAYWDMYQAMGGHNSMPSWVRANPQLAGEDYTHFTPNGAKLIANMFYNALMIEMLPQ